MISLNAKINSPNVSFMGYSNSRTIDYTNAVGDTVLPKNCRVKVASDAVLELGVKGDRQNYLLCMSDRRIQNLPNGSVVSVGRQGKITIPNTYGKVSRDHLYIYKNPDGIMVEDVSSNSTIISYYKDFTHKPVYTLLPKAIPVVLNEDSVLRLANSTVVDFGTDKMKQILNRMQEGKVYSLGKEADISIDTKNPNVSRKHIEIMKSSGKIVVNDISTNGTTIGEKERAYSSYYYDTNSSRGSQNSSSSSQRSQSSRSRAESERSQENRRFWDDYFRNGGEYSNPFEDKQSEPKSEPKKQQKSEQTIEFEKDMEKFFKDPSKSAYRNLSMKWHPDHETGSEEKFKSMHELLQKKGYIDSKGHWKD